MFRLVKNKISAFLHKFKEKKRIHKKTKKRKVLKKEKKKKKDRITLKNIFLILN